MKLMLNTRKPGNYAFYDPKTGLHLTLGSPVGFTDGTSKYIERGLKTKGWRKERKNIENFLCNIE
jgi:hypothetical protein